VLGVKDNNLFFSSLNQNSYLDMVQSLDLKKEEKNKLLSLTPSTYLGEVAKILKEL
jgi:hypothetical protein